MMYVYAKKNFSKIINLMKIKLISFLDQLKCCYFTYILHVDTEWNAYTQVKLYEYISVQCVIKWIVKQKQIYKE